MPSTDPPPTPASEFHEPTPETFGMLRLTAAPGFGPVLIARSIATLGSVQAVLDASETALLRVRGIGTERARQIAAALPGTEALAQRELAACQKLGAYVLSISDQAYPSLLRGLPDAPPVLCVRGTLDPDTDRFALGIVGSRKCTHYGIEQTERFAAQLAQTGITIISGGALGIDTAAHRAALRVGGRTIVVLGCGLSHCFPPANRELFDQIVASGRGAIISELPCNTPPTAENFPARNRIISGMALGVLVIEAGRKSGALITARVAAEDHGREVFALPSRVDSEPAMGSLDLLKSGGAQLVTHPDDILQALETPARHAATGKHQDRYAAMPSLEEDLGDDLETSGELDVVKSTAGSSAKRPPKANSHALGASKALPAPASGDSPRDVGLSPQQRVILGALESPCTVDELSQTTGLSAAVLRADITILEIKRRIQRQGSRLARV